MFSPAKAKNRRCPIKRLLRSYFFCGEDEFSLTIESENLLFGERSIVIKIHVPDEEPSGGELTEDAERSSFPQPLCPHAESNGSHG